MKNIVKDWTKPPYADKYVSMDIGFKDLTFVIFAYYDFKAGKVIVEDEYIINGPAMTTDKLAYAIYDKENELWSYDNDDVEPYMRISDTDHIVLNNLYMNHGLSFKPTDKDNNEAAINDMRMMIGSERIIINPRCKNLIFHLQNATWKDQRRKEYDRSPDAGHYDGVDALKYLLRNIHYHRNPYPANYSVNAYSNTFISPHYREERNSFKEGLKDIFTLGNKKRNKR